MIFKRSYKEISAEIEALNVKASTKAAYLVVAVLIGLLAISGGIAILINLLIFIDFRPLYISLIALLLILFCYLVDRIYLRLLTKGDIKDISVIYIQDTFIMAFCILAMLLIILELEVI